MEVMEEDRYCPVINQVIPEIECYETVCGCADTMVYKQTLLPHPEVKKICWDCPFSDIE